METKLNHLQPTIIHPSKKVRTHGEYLWSYICLPITNKEANYRAPLINVTLDTEWLTRSKKEDLCEYITLINFYAQFESPTSLEVFLLMCPDEAIEKTLQHTMETVQEEVAYLHDIISAFVPE